MKCPRCSYDNPANTSFCEDCGFKLDSDHQKDDVQQKAARDIMKAKLVLEDGQEFVLSDRTTIGRSDDNDIQIRDPHVSRRHAVILREGDTFTIRGDGADGGGSINGLAINDSPRFFGESRPLVNADEITLGRTKVRFVIE